jgi:hypothetical protein
MDYRSKVFAELAECILVDGAYKATRYLDPKLTIKATRKRYKGKIYKDDNIDIVFTVGKPNYEEREELKRSGLTKTQFPWFTKVKYPPNMSKDTAELKRQLAKKQAEYADIKAKRDKLIRSI